MAKKFIKEKRKSELKSSLTSKPLSKYFSLETEVRSENSQSENLVSEPDNLSRQYINIISSIKENKDEMVRSGSIEIEELMNYTNNLFENITRPSTLRLDALFLTESTHISSTHLEKNLRSQGISTETFVDLIKNKDKKLIVYHDVIKTESTGVYFPKRLVLNMQDEQEKNVTSRRRGQKTQIESLMEPSVPKVITDIKGEDNSQIIVKKMQNIITQFQRVEFFRLVLDPNSYSKSIENMFYLSFCIKQNMFGLVLENNILYVINNNGNIKNDGGHMILGIEYEEYLDILKKLDIKKPMIG